jgi:uncharacterized membrane protein YvbJ
MKFCNKCGNEIKEGQIFCTSCGNDLRKKATNEIETSEEIESKTEATEEDNFIPNTPKEKHISNFKLSKGSKIAMIVVTILILATVIFIQVGNSLNDPKKLVARFEKDVALNNTSDLSNILYCNDARLKIDSKSISPLLGYFKSNPSYFDNALQNLNNDAISPKDISNITIATSNTLTLCNVGKNLFIFPKYKINIRPSFIDITAGVKDVSFSINKTKIGKSDSDNSTKELGPYIPGNYSILASYNGKYVTLNKPYPVDLVSASNGIAKISVFNDMMYLNVSSDYPNAEIFVDGKDTNVEVKDASNFGPIDSSAKIYATTVKDGNTIKTQEYSPTSGSTGLDLSFEQSMYNLDNVENQLSGLLNNYISSFTQAINTGNPSLTDPYVVSGSELYSQEHSSYITDTYNEGTQENNVSAKITNYNISNDDQSGTITTSEVYNFIAKDGTSSNKTFNYIYNFQYNNATSSYQFKSVSVAH